VTGISRLRRAVRVRAGHGGVRLRGVRGVGDGDDVLHERAAPAIGARAGVGQQVALLQRRGKAAGGDGDQPVPHPVRALVVELHVIAVRRAHGVQVVGGDVALAVGDVQEVALDDAVVAAGDLRVGAGGEGGGHGLGRAVRGDPQAVRQPVRLHAQERVALGDAVQRRHRAGDAGAAEHLVQRALGAGAAMVRVPAAAVDDDGGQRIGARAGVRQRQRRLEALRCGGNVVRAARGQHGQGGKGEQAESVGSHAASRPEVSRWRGRG